MPAERADRQYRFEPLDTSGVFLGLGLVQCLLLGAGLVAAVAGLTAGVPLPVCVAPLLGSVAVSFARVRGRAAWQWLPLLLGWGWLRARRGRRWLAPLPLLPHADGGATPLPPCLAGVRILEVPWRGSLRLGAVEDTERHTLTALVRVAGPQFVVQPRAEQERLLVGWGDVLNQYAVERGVVVHLSWSDFAQHSGLEQHRAWLASVDHGDVPAAAAESYGELLGEAAGTATTHDVVLSLTVARERLGRAGDGDDPDERLARALVTTVEALLRGVHSAGLSAGDPLCAGDVRRLLRTRIDPFACRPRLVDGRLVDRLGLDAASSAGPMALELDWRHVHIDGAWHRTWWVEVWPRLAVPAAWLEPFLAGGGITRAITVYLVPASTYQARRRIERDLVKLESDAATKEEKGRRVDARHRRATQALLDREEELVAGYAEMGYVGLVTVSATSAQDLERHAEVVEQLARENGMELRLLDCRQDVAWAAALPFGLAPRSLLA